MNPEGENSLISTIRRLFLLMEEERRAIGALNSVRVLAIADEKAELALRLRAIVAHENNNEALWSELLVQARANFALITDTLNAISETMGVDKKRCVYDARARIHADTPTFAHRDV